MKIKTAIGYMFIGMVMYMAFTILVGLDLDPHDWASAKTGTVCYEIESLPGTIKHRRFFHSKKECKRYINGDY